MLFLSLFVFGYSPYYQNDMGGSSLGMGGVPIGLNNSVECGLYNPAAFSSTEKLNVFAGCKLTKGEMSYVVYPEDSLRLDYAFPDYLGVALPFGGDCFLSVSLSVPYKFVRRDSITITVVDTSGFKTFPGEYIQSERFYFLNTTIGKAINDKFSVGVNMGLFWARSRDYGVVYGPEYDENFIHIDKYGIEPCLGLQYKASDILSVGFLVKKGLGKAYRVDLDGAVYSSASDERLPLVLGLGAGVNLKDKIYLNVSGEYMWEYIRWTLAYPDLNWEAVDYRSIIRLHLGGQYRFNDLLSLSAGFYTEPSPVKIASGYDQGSWDQMFVTGGVGLDFGPVALNLSAASSALIKKDPSFREENHLNVSLVYR